MKQLSSADLKRNPVLMDKKIIESQSSFLAGEDLTMIFPARWLESAANLARIDILVSLVGVVCILDSDNNYTIMKIPTRITCNPNRITDIKIDDEDYKEMHFGRGEQLICNKDIVKDNSDLFSLFSEMYFKANIPFFLVYDEIDDVFINADKYCGSKVGQNTMAIELMTMVISKDGDNLSVPYRIAINSNPNTKLKYVNLLNPFHTFKSTFSRISGSYSKTGRLAAIIDPSENDENKLENILRA